MSSPRHRRQLPGEKDVPTRRHIPRRRSFTRSLPTATLNPPDETPPVVATAPDPPPRTPPMSARWLTAGLATLMVGSPWLFRGAVAQDEPRDEPKNEAGEKDEQAK